MIRRPRRTLPATLVALVLLAAAALTAVSCVQVLTGRPPWLPFTAAAAFGATLTWSHPLTLVVALIVLLLGLVLLAAAVVPGAPTVLALVGAADQPTSGATRASVATALRNAAGAVDGVDTATVRVRGGAVTATVRTPIRESAALAEQVRAAITDRLDDLALARAPRIRVRVATRSDT